VAPTPPEGESPDVAWFSWAQAIEVAEPGLEGVLRAVQPGRPTLRRAVVDDAAACARVYVRACNYAIDEVAGPRTEAEIAAWMAGQAIPSSEVWVADLEGVVVGLLLLGPGSIRHVHVDPAWIGRGLDEELIALAGPR
jgi:hypothetical protein